ncbi:MAG: hypothetical protein KDC18_14645, partial [Alphaproteobacteria bacterium]|nr:hypothetical protein [Alphaproteobacteria bacterium]
AAPAPQAEAPAPAAPAAPEAPATSDDVIVLPRGAQIPPAAPPQPMAQPTAQPAAQPMAPAAAPPAAAAAEPNDRPGRWSLFGGKLKPRPMPATRPGESFVAASPARPPQGQDAPMRTAVHAPAAAGSGGESAPANRPGLGGLFGRKAEAPPAPAQPRPAADDATVHVLPKQAPAPASPNPVHSSQPPEDMLEIPAFLRRQAR